MISVSPGTTEDKRRKKGYVLWRPRDRKRSAFHVIKYLQGKKGRHPAPKSTAVPREDVFTEKRKVKQPKQDNDFSIDNVTLSLYPSFSFSYMVLEKE